MEGRALSRPDGLIEADGTEAVPPGMRTCRICHYEERPSSLYELRGTPMGRPCEAQRSMGSDAVIQDYCSEKTDGSLQARAFSSSLMFWSGHQYIGEATRGPVGPRVAFGSPPALCPKLHRKGYVHLPLFVPSHKQLARRPVLPWVHRRAGEADRGPVGPRTSRTFGPSSAYCCAIGWRGDLRSTGSAGAQPLPLPFPLPLPGLSSLRR
jgi:hypothetical protein